MIKGLFAKLYGLILVPTTAFIITSIFFINLTYNEYWSNKLVYDSSPVLVASVDLLSAMQAERGMSIAYLSGIDKREKLLLQRDKVDEYLKKYKKTLSEVSVEELKGQSDSIVTAVDLRTQISQKSVKKSRVEAVYTEAIHALMHKIIILKDLIKDPYISKILFNIAELDEAKENGGLLKAHLTSAIGVDGKLSDEELTLLLELKSRYKSYSTSKILSFSTDATTDLHTQFLNLPEQKTVEDVFMTVLKNDESRKEINPVNFFETISVVIDRLNDVIVSEMKYLKNVALVNYEDARQSLILICSLIAIYLFFTIFFTLKVIGSLIAQFRDSLHSLNNKTLSIQLLTEKLNNTSDEVKKSSVNQATDIESTSSALTEISATLERNSRLLGSIESEVQGTQSVVGEGKNQVANVMKSIREIAEANEKFIAQVQKNDEDFEKVTSVINEISEKTMIIDDIVFQTKLLSFNASVEAARAGENGKGFAVVAEEIGSLASMSGNAAAEITQLVSSSKNMVSSVRGDMLDRVNASVEQNKSKISQGTEQANSCSQNFEEIFTSVENVYKFLQDFRVSSDEQESAMREITDNIVQLDKATKSNLTSVDNNFEVSGNIKKNTSALQGVVDLMCVIIRGETISEERRRQKESGGESEFGGVVVLQGNDTKTMVS